MPRRAPVHRPVQAAAKVHRIGADKQKERRRQKTRALPTNSTAWRAIRAAQLAREPLCRVCKRAGQVVLATDVDHVDGDSWNNAPPNLQSLCKPHHSAKTAREDGGFGNARRGVVKE